MRYSLSLLENESKIYNLILKEIQQTLEHSINQAIPKITSETKEVVGSALRNQPEYVSLMAGTLKAEFGIPDSSIVNAVIESLVNTLTITKQNIIIKPKLGISGGIILQMIPSTLNDILNTNAANITADGYNLPWLRWLLLEGTNDIVKNYNVSYGTYPYSRSGLAIMKNAQSNWSVPSQFAGTQDNNWTTRAINSINNEINNIIQNNIEKYL